MRLAPYDPLPSDLIVGGIPPHGSALRNAPNPPNTPRSGLPLTLLLLLSLISGGGYVLFRSSRSRAMLSALLTLTSSRSREQADFPPPAACPPRIQW